MTGRRSGISTPLFSLASTAGWGIGEFPDLAAFAQWAVHAGQSAVQILPIGELTPGEQSPYSALTAMALDPIYIRLPGLPEFTGAGGETVLAASDRAEIEAIRMSPAIAYRAVRELKERCLRECWQRFQDLEMARGSPRARDFDAFVARERWWLDEYALFRALHARHGEYPWWQWPAPIAEARPGVVARWREDLFQEITYRQYLQWVAAGQWDEARRQAWPLRIYGDLPFMIARDSADVWARQEQFVHDATVGAPPDAFSEEGQDWSLPPWRCEVMQRDDFRWMRARARRSAALFDGVRLDHLVGLYRTYVRPVEESLKPYFVPDDEADQVELGETILRIYIDAGADVIAEDLGTVPDYVRASMERLGVPGLKVLRWERRWDEPGRPAIDPRTFPERSVATTGTHDVDPLAALVGSGSGQPGDLGVETSHVAASSIGRAGRPSRDDLLAAVDATLQALLNAGSALTLIPIQDAFGWPDRINTPGTVSDENWTWRVPHPVDRWLAWPEAIERADRLRGMTREAGRSV